MRPTRPRTRSYPPGGSCLASGIPGLRRLAQPDRRQRRPEGAPPSHPAPRGVGRTGVSGRRIVTARGAAGPARANGSGPVRRQRRDRTGLRPAATEGPDDPRPPPRRGATCRRDRAIARDPRWNRQVATPCCPPCTREGDGGRGMNGLPLTDVQISTALRGHLPERAARGLRERVSTRPRPPASCGRCPRSSGPSATRTRLAVDAACSSPLPFWLRWQSQARRRSGRGASSSRTPSTS